MIFIINFKRLSGQFLVTHNTYKNAKYKNSKHICSKLDIQGGFASASLKTMECGVAVANYVLCPTTTQPQSPAPKRHRSS